MISLLVSLRLPTLQPPGLKCHVNISGHYDEYEDWVQTLAGPPELALSAAFN